MPLHRIRRRTAEALAAVLESAFDHRPDEVGLDIPPRRELGDLAWPGALPLAKVLRRNPREIAQTVADTAEWPTEVDRVEVAGPGFLNLYLRRGVVLRQLLDPEAASSHEASRVKTIVEHTNINPNKAAHIGHLRNAVLGDVLVRCLRELGYEVEVQNYIDDTGVQVADVVVGVLYLPETELAQSLGTEVCRRDELIEMVVDRLPDDAVPQASTTDFDDLCWEIYPRVTARYEADSEFAARRAEVLHAIEEGAGAVSLEESLFLLKGSVVAGEPYSAHAVARLAAEVAAGNVRCHLATMARLGVAYDVLPHESDILRLGFWTRAFQLLESSGAIRLETEGKNAGCWVMSLASSPEFAKMDDPDKILVRSTGTVTYTGKDIAYQLWKFGLLRDPDGSRHDFGYLPFAAWRRQGPALPILYDEGDTVLYRTSSDPQDRPAELVFGAGQRVYNVIDVRQSYPQKVVKEAVRVLGHPEAADNSVHFAYEMVALTPAAVRLMEEESGTSFGLTDEDMAKAFVEMSGRRGIGVKADEFLDVLVSAAEDAVVERIGHAGEVADLAIRSRAIAVGALRYLMARQSRNRVLAFDFDDALAFEGDTGPYLQYSAVRATKIFDKLRERRGEGTVTAQERDRLDSAEVQDDLWELVLQCALRRDVVAQSITSLEFSLLAQHAHGLAQLFHKLYHGHPVVPEKDPAVRLLRRAVFTVFVEEMRFLLEDLLGIPVPAEM
jgi:arginyl-tRNA synthetase